MKVNLKGGFALIIALVIAVGVAVILIKTKSPLEHVAVEMPSRVVETITAREIPFRTRITAYGSVEPAITLNSMAEVSGKISYMHPNLKSGETIPVGTLVASVVFGMLSATLLLLLVLPAAYAIMEGLGVREIGEDEMLFIEQTGT